jgi:glycogen debranching enzyme
VAEAPDPEVPVAPPPDGAQAAAASAGPEAEPPARLAALRHDHERWDSGATDIFTDNEEVNRVLRRGQEDLRMLSAQLGGSRIPFSGLPWFAAPFGRELAFVGLETLLLDLRWASGAVDFLQARQGSHENAFRDEQPGKILHELRRGELAGLKAVPHTPYFGSIDATPLWLLLVAELTMWTGDLDGFEARRDAVDAALAWIDTYGDLDGDGFVEYERRSRAGLLNQGWRDAGDAVLHADGRPAEGSIALAETQGYVYYAKRRLAAVFGELGDVDRAAELSRQAAALKRAFNECFWMEDQGFFAMALDGRKEQVSGICSTIGHTLWTRIVGDEHVDAVVRRLMAPDMFTGWGVRTFSKDMAGYNPVSFYNGSVWPFDTAVIANGMKKHGYTQESNRLAWGLVEAAGAHEYERLPEMFCGFTRRSINKPVAFPMACSPDASSAGALFLILQSMLGIYAQADENIVYVHDPDLPKWLGEVTLTNLKVGRTSMRLRFRREGAQTSFAVLDKQGPGRIVVVE